MHHAKGAASKDAEAAAGKAAAKSSRTLPPLTVAQTQQPLGGLFEPIGCPCLGTPGGVDHSTTVQSISSSNRGRSHGGGALRPYSAAVAPAAVNVKADAASERGQATQHAQQLMQKGGLPAVNVINSSHSRHSTAHRLSCQHAQQGQQAALHTPAEADAADDLLSEEAAAADAIMDTLSLQSQYILHSRHTDELPVGATLESESTELQDAQLALLAQGPTKALQQDVTNEAKQQQRLVCQQLKSGVDQQQQQQQQPTYGSDAMGKGKLSSARAPEPQQGYPGVPNRAPALPFGRSGQCLSEKQVRRSQSKACHQVLCGFRGFVACELASAGGMLKPWLASDHFHNLARHA